MKKESVLNQLASSLGRRDELPNQELAKKISDNENTNAVSELVKHLQNKNKDIRYDCIKVLYELGALDARMIAGHASAFVALLESKDNRLQWGGMTALNTIAGEQPKVIYRSLQKIIAAAQQGSVITNDQCVNILVQLCGVKEYAADVFPLLLERLLKAPDNQLPMYAERSLPIINKQNKTAFIKVLQARIPSIEKDTKRKRLEKVIKTLEKI